MALRPLAVVLTAALLVACSAPSAPDDIPLPAPDPVVIPSAVREALVHLTNVERATAGLPALRTESRLMHAAQIHAEQMAQAGVVAHTLDGARYPTLLDRLAAGGYAWRASGENLAFGQRDAAHAVDSWMQSSGHRANILNDSFTEIGAGHVADAIGRGYYVQVFARPR